MKHRLPRPSKAKSQKSQADQPELLADGMAPDREPSADVPNSAKSNLPMNETITALDSPATSSLPSAQADASAGSGTGNGGHVALAPAQPDASAPFLIQTRGLVKQYGGRRVVNGVDIHVRTGEVVGLLG